MSDWFFFTIILYFGRTNFEKRIEISRTTRGVNNTVIVCIACSVNPMYYASLLAPDEDACLSMSSRNRETC